MVRITFYSDICCIEIQTINDMKATLEHWNLEETYYNVEAVKYQNHRGKEKTKYVVLNRVTINVFKEQIVSYGMKGMVYYENDLLIHN